MRNETRNRFPIKYSICCILVLLLALICTVSQSGAATETGFRLLENWTGDFDGMVERRSVRALVVFSKTNYFLDGAQQLGATYEGMKEFEKKINEKLKRGHLKLNVVFIPGYPETGSSLCFWRARATLPPPVSRLPQSEKNK